MKDSKIKTFIHDDKTYFVFPSILLIAFIISCFFPSSVFADVKTSGRIWIAGDSIAADHSYEKEEDYADFVHGWGEVLENYLTDNVQVFNKAISGQSAKYFVEENNYKDIMSGISEGDILLIQFGHNDYKSDGSNHYSLPTTTEGSYKWYLKNYYIDPALNAGAIPVLCTSVVCCEFVDGIVRENQPQSLFAGAMRELYNEYRDAGINIGLIDTYELTQTMLNAYSSSASSFYAVKYDRSGGTAGNRSTSLDHVHFSLKGAKMTAGMIAENLFLLYPDFNRFNRQNIIDGGDGTEGNPYEISSFSQIYRILRDNKMNKENIFYKLTKDLDPVIQNKECKDILYANIDFGGHTIKNAVGRVQSSLFDKNYGIISNLSLSYSINHTCEDIQYPLVNENYGVIRNCTASGYIWYDCFLKNREEWNCGIFAGVNRVSGEIYNCSSNINMTVNTDIPRTIVGGITGKNEGSIYKCENNGKLKLDMTEYSLNNNKVHEIVHCICSGIAGISSYSSKITDCKSILLPTVMTTLKSDKQIVLSDLNFINESAVTEINDKKGDIDLDGEVSLSDATEILKYALNIAEPDKKKFFIADINSDGEINLTDANSALQLALGII